MNKNMKPMMSEATKILQQGGVVAYPTEAVYGLGCNPMDSEAVKRLLALKHRSVDKGLILIASAWEQVVGWIKPVDDILLQRVFATWPGPVTWVFPASSNAPAWITGKHPTIALRVTAHPVAKALCDAFDGALVSTSANVEGQPPAKTASEVQAIFGNQVDCVVEGETGGLAKPTEIKDVESGETIRQ